MKKIQFSMGVAAILLLFAAPIFANALQADIDTDSTVLGESVTYTLTVSGNLESEVEFPSLDGLSVTGTGNSSQMQIVNGQISRQVSLIFYLQASKAGSFTIPGIRAKVDGKVQSSNAVKLVVRNPSSHLPSQNSNNNLPLAFIERKFSNTKPYEGQAITSTTKVYSRLKLTAIERSNNKASNVRYFEIDRKESREEYGGQIYQVISYYDTLVPQASGEISLPAEQVRIRAIVPSQRRRHRDFFSDFFGQSMSQQKESSLASRADLLNVKAVPKKGRPQDYKGLVGAFSLKSELSSKSLKQGETSTLTLKFAGRGLLDSMGKLPLDLGPHIKIYPDKPEHKEKPHLKYGLLSERVYKFALVPTKAGPIDLGEIKIPYFDLRENAFAFLSSHLGSIEVEAVQEINKVSSTSNHNSRLEQKNAVNTLASDLIDIHRPENFEEQHYMKMQEFVNKLSIALCFCFLYFGNAAFFMWRRKSKTRSPKLRSSKALKTFKAKKQNWHEKWKEQITSQEAVNAYYLLYRDYLGDKFNKQGSAMTTNEVKKHINTLKLDKKQEEKAISLSQTMDQLSFSKANLETKKVHEILSAIDILVGEVEKRC